MYPNKVILSKTGIIEIHVVGDQTAESVQAMGRAAEKLVLQQRKAKKPVLILDVLLHMGVVPPEGRKAVVQYGKTLDYDRLAMLGSGSVLRLGSNLLLQAVGKGSKVKYFDDLQKATDWLWSA